MSLIYGVRGVGDWTTPDERPKTYHEMIFKLVPELAPLFNLTSKLGEETVRDMEYAVFEEGLVVGTLQVNGVHTDVDTTIDLDGVEPVKAVRAGDILRVRRTDELMRVALDPAAPYTTVTVEARGSWGGGNLALADHDQVDILSSAGVEAGTAPAAISDTLAVVWNYLQDIEEACELSDWAEDMEIRPKSEKAYAREKRRAMERFKAKWERTLYYGKKVSALVGGKRSYATAGINALVSTNTFDDSVTGTSVDRIFEIFQQLRSYGQGSDSKWGFAGAGAITRITNLVRKSTVGNFNLSDPLDRRGTFGMKVLDLEGPTMRLQLIHSGTLSQIDTNKVFILDPKYIKLARYGSKIGPVHFDDNIKTDDGYKGRKGRWRAVLGLMLGQETVHGKWSVGEPIPS